MSGRAYRLQKRAESQDATRERIVEATVALHAAQGVAATSYVQIAERAGVGPATVYRHFPALGSLVEACGAVVEGMIRAPAPEDAPAVFAGLATREARLDRLVAELDAFYTRGASWLAIAAHDRERIAQLDAFLHHVDAGIAALVREALGPGAEDAAVKLVAALADVSVWKSLKRLKLPPAELRRTMVKLFGCAIRAAAPTGAGA